MVQKFTDTEACANVFSSRLCNKANIFLGLIKYELNSLLGASHFVYVSVHIRFDLEGYLLNSMVCGIHPLEISHRLCQNLWH